MQANKNRGWHPVRPEDKNRIECDEPGCIKQADFCEHPEYGGGGFFYFCIDHVPERLLALIQSTVGRAMAAKRIYKSKCSCGTCATCKARVRMSLKRANNSIAQQTPGRED